MVTRYHLARLAYNDTVQSSRPRSVRNVSEKAQSPSIPQQESHSRVQAHDLRDHGAHVLQLIRIRSVDLATALEPAADFFLHTLHHRRVLAKQIRTENQRRGGSIGSSKEERERVTLEFLLRELIVALVLKEEVGHVRLAGDVATLSPLLRQSGDHVIQIIHHLESAFGQDRSQDRPDLVAFERSQGRTGYYAVEEGPDEQVRFVLRQALELFAECEFAHSVEGLEDLCQCPFLAHLETIAGRHDKTYRPLKPVRHVLHLLAVRALAQLRDQQVRIPLNQSRQFLRRRSRESRSQ